MWDALRLLLVIVAYFGTATLITLIVWVGFVEAKKELKGEGEKVDDR